MWDDRLKGSAPPTVRTLALPPTSSELFVVQQHRMSMESFTLGAFTSIPECNYVEFQLIFNTGGDHTVANTIPAFLVFMKYEGLNDLPHFLEYFHNRCESMRILLKACADHALRIRCIDYTMCAMELLPALTPESWEDAWDCPFLYDTTSSVVYPTPRIPLPNTRLQRLPVQNTQSDGWTVEELPSNTTRQQRLPTRDQRPSRANNRGSEDSSFDSTQTNQSVPREPVRMSYDRPTQPRHVNRHSPVRQEPRELSPPRYREQVFPTINQSPIRRPQRRGRLVSNVYGDDDEYNPRRPRWHDDIPSWGQRARLDMNDDLLHNRGQHPMERNRMAYSHAAFRNWTERDIRNPSPSVSSLEDESNLLSLVQLNFAVSSNIKTGKCFLRRTTYSSYAVKLSQSET
jgi:hypothetical protein